MWCDLGLNFLTLGRMCVFSRMRACVYEVMHTCAGNRWKLYPAVEMFPTMIQSWVEMWEITSTSTDELLTQKSCSWRPSHSCGSCSPRGSCSSDAASVPGESSITSGSTSTWNTANSPVSILIQLTFILLPFTTIRNMFREPYFFMLTRNLW